MIIQKKHWIIIALIFVFFLGAEVYNYGRALREINEASAVTVGTPNPGHTWDQMECNANSLCVDTTNNLVGIGTNTPSTKLDVAQNGAIKVGQAYLSSGGDYLHLANNEWFNGSAWTTDGIGGDLLQLTGQALNIYRHDAVGGHVFEATIDSNGNLGVGTSTPAQKLEVSGNIFQLITMSATDQVNV